MIKKIHTAFNYPTLMKKLFEFELIWSGFAEKSQRNQTESTQLRSVWILFLPKPKPNQPIKPIPEK